MREPGRQQWFVLGIMVLLSVFFLLTPFVARSLQGNDSLLGQESYFHLGVAQDMLEPGSYQSGNARPTLFDLFVAALVLVMAPLLVGKLVPVLLGVVVVVVFFFQVRRLVDEEEQATASLLLLISPLYLMLFSSLAPAGFVLLLALVSWLLYDRRPLLSIGLLGLLVFIDARGFVIASLLLLAYALLRCSSWKPAAIGGGAGLAVIIFLQGFFGFVAREWVLMPASVSDFFVSLGADFGYSFFILFLGLVGLLASWSRKRQHVAASVILLVVFVFSFGDTTARVLMLPVTAVLAGKGILVLVRRSWTVKSIRNATLFLVGLSLLFTLVLTVSGQVGQEPGSEKLEALRFLRTIPDEEVVLSSSANGIFIESIARQPAFLDDVMGDGQVRWQREVAAHRIFMAQRVSLAEELLEENGISHILIDEDMRAGGVWTHEEQGLLFLLGHSDRFVKLYDKGGVQIYRFVEG